MTYSGDFSFVLHSHLPYVLSHGRWPHGTDWLFEAAAETGTVMEISAHPMRLDLNDVYARRAIELGVFLSINTDAHEPSHLDLRFFGAAIARRGWLPPDKVINTWEAVRLIEWLKRNRN